MITIRTGAGSPREEPARTIAGAPVALSSATTSEDYRRTVSRLMRRKNRRGMQRYPFGGRYLQVILREKVAVRFGMLNTYL
jgi:hypothetical protein